mmetsp:Transcript_16470/g.40539  ORF Transcript_16470/g.40539 Transcript_16470/m.40539 type:complete len:254 (+) Transcript_16470:704-1465(+)
MSSPVLTPRRQQASPDARRSRGWWREWQREGHRPPPCVPHLARRPRAPRRGSRPTAARARYMETQPCVRERVGTGSGPGRRRRRQRRLVSSAPASWWPRRSARGHTPSSTGTTATHLEGKPAWSAACPMPAACPTRPSTRHRNCCLCRHNRRRRRCGSSSNRRRVYLTAAAAAVMMRAAVATMTTMTTTTTTTTAAALGVVLVGSRDGVHVRRRRHSRRDQASVPCRGRRTCRLIGHAHRRGHCAGFARCDPR